MSKKYLTIYLPEEFFVQAKIKSFEEGYTFSDFVALLALIYCKNDAPSFQSEGTYSSDKKKAGVYLCNHEMKHVKQCAAKKNATLSHLICQAISYGLENQIDLDQESKSDFFKRDCCKPFGLGNKEKEEARERKQEDEDDKRIVTYSLTPENDYRIRMLSIERGNSRSRLIFKLAKEADLNDLRSIDTASKKSVRSSLLLKNEEYKILKTRAQKTRVGISEFINRVIAFESSVTGLT